MARGVPLQMHLMEGELGLLCQALAEETDSGELLCTEDRALRRSRLS